MRTLDWSATPLGPPDRWPEALRTMVGLLLHNHSGFLLWWGPRFVQLYNDAYRPVLGDKHPRSMGQPASECWPEIWHIIGPMIEVPFNGGPASTSDDLFLLLNRRGFVEEAHFKVAYSPVPDPTVPSTGIGGVLATVSETTEQVYGERQLRTLRELAARAADAKAPADACISAAAVLAENPWDVPFALLYLLESDGRKLRLAGSAGFGEDHADSAPAELNLDDGNARWPLADAIAQRQPRTIEDPPGPLPTGRWSQAPSSAIALPLASPDQQRPYGVLVCGISPHRRLDAGYRTFFELAAAQVVTGIRNAVAFETERRRAEALAELDRAKTAFFSNVSHEFRTPLTLMLGPTEDALAREGTLSGESLAMVHRNVLRLLKLVNTLLDFSRIEAGRAQASFEPTDLALVTRDLASAFRSAIESSGMRLVVECPPLAEPIWVDRDMWEKIVLNLLSNAFKFTFEGQIRVSLREAADGAILTVSDTGIGISKENLPRVFERFHRVEGARARTHEGSGIGLALVQDLVRLHGGEIRVESESERGTTFTVLLRSGHAHLPASQVRESVSRAAAGSSANAWVTEALRWLPDGSRAQAPGREQQFHAGRLLVADDNADMRDYLRHLLEPLWEVELAPDGAAALAAARRRRPDAIVSDVMMPALDGFTLVSRLRSDPDLRSIPVMLLSARAGEEAQVEGLRSGADDYLIKPFSPPELLARVNNLMRQAGGRRLLEEERKRMRDLLAQVPAIVNFLRGPELLIEFAHPLAEQRAARPLAGKPLLEAFPEFRGQPIPERLRRVYETGEPFASSEAPVPLVIDGERQETYWNSLYQAVRRADGTIEGVMTFDIEVTDQVKARRALEAANRSKDEFLAILGHELRNPLAPIRTAIELLRMRGEHQPEHALIERQVGQLLRLVEDLLDVSRVTAGKVDLRKRPLAIRVAIARAIEMVEPVLEKQKHLLHYDPPPDSLRVEADEQRLVQVFSNVLMNAAKYSPPGRNIWVSGAAAGRWVRVSVRDEGIGIEPEFLEEIFHPFVQRHGPGSDSRGLGLGLAIARNLIRTHGGELTARSAGRGQGSEFVVDLPLFDGADIAPLPFQPAPAKAEVRRSILVVDDNLDAAAMLADLLETVGHDVRTARDGPQALALAAQRRPDILLLDIGLPVMDGYEVARRLRALDSTIRIIAVTGYGQERKPAESAKAFDARLVKPVEFDDVLRLIS